MPYYDLIKIVDLISYSKHTLTHPHTPFQLSNRKSLLSWEGSEDLSIHWGVNMWHYDSRDYSDYRAGSVKWRLGWLLMCQVTLHCNLPLSFYATDQHRGHWYPLKGHKGIPKPLRIIKGLLCISLWHLLSLKISVKHKYWWKVFTHSVTDIIVNPH